jgi:chromosome segregation ATPase
MAKYKSRATRLGEWQSVEVDTALQDVVNLLEEMDEEKNKWKDAVGQTFNIDISEAECLRDEIQSWYDNLTDNLQQTSKAQMLEDAVSELEDLISECEDVNSTEVAGEDEEEVRSSLEELQSRIEDIQGRTVDFPGMYG